MADVGKRLYGPAQPGTSNATLYTAPATGCIVRSVQIVNTTDITATISLAINGTAATAANAWLGFVLSIPARAVVSFNIFDWLGNADTIQGLQGTASALTVTISGIEQ